MQIISKVQTTILKLFGEIADSDQFYLTGGTALAYFYLHHRKSNDLDFFTSTSDLVLPFSRTLEEKLIANRISVERRRSMHSFVEFWVKQGEESTIIQLAQDAAFRFEPPTPSSEFPNLKVDNLSDVASNKLLALFGRAMLRDFIDIFFLVKTGKFSQSSLIENAQKKDPGFDLYWLGIAFERIRTFDSQSQELLLLLKPLKFSDLTDFFYEWKRQIEQTLKK